VNRTVLRLEALKLAVATQGYSDKVALAGTYLTFLAADETTPTQAQQQPTRQKGR
jgi:hypothetical protein